MEKESKALCDAIDDAFQDFKKLDNPFCLSIVKPTPFNSLWSALAFVIEHKLKGWTIVKVGEKYEVH